MSSSISALLLHLWNMSVWRQSLRFKSVEGSEKRVQSFTPASRNYNVSLSLSPPHPLGRKHKNCNTTFRECLADKQKVGGECCVVVADHQQVTNTHTVTHTQSYGYDTGATTMQGGSRSSSNILVLNWLASHFSFQCLGHLVKIISGRDTIWVAAFLWHLLNV